MAMQRIIGTVTEKAVAAESDIDTTPGVLYGWLATSAAGVDATVKITPVVNDVDIDIDSTVLQAPNSQMFILPVPIKYGSLKATLTGAGTTLFIFHGV